MPGERGDQDPAGLGLPPGVDDGAVVTADVGAVPDPGLGVDGLAHRAEQAQAGEVVAGREVLPPLHEGPDGGGRGVEDVDLVLLDDLPPAVPGRRVGGALVHDRGGGVGQGAVDDVAVPGDPADVRRRPVDVLVGLDVEDEAVGGRDMGQVAPRGVEDPLGLGRRPAGVHDVQRVLGVEGLGLVRRRLAVDHLVPPHVAALVPRHVLAGAPHHQDLLHFGRSGDCFVHRRLERAGRAAAVAPVGRDDEVRITVEDAAAQRVGGEAAEDHGVRRPQAGAGQHGHHRLGDHGHVDGDLVARLHPQLDQGVGRLADRGQQVRIGDGPGVAGLALPVEGHPVAQAGVNVAVNTVDRHVEPAPHEPLGKGRIAPVQNVRPVSVPREVLGLGGPEGMGICLGLVINTWLRVGPLGQRCGRREGPCLVQEGRQPLLSNFAHLALLLPGSLRPSCPCCLPLMSTDSAGAASMARRVSCRGAVYDTSTTATTTGAGRGANGMVGMSAFLNVSFTTPAKDVYQATAAVAIPK